jgi:hypothetical protein
MLRVASQMATKMITTVQMGAKIKSRMCLLIIKNLHHLTRKVNNPRGKTKMMKMRKMIRNQVATMTTMEMTRRGELRRSRVPKVENWIKSMLMTIKI